MALDPSQQPSLFQVHIFKALEQLEKLKTSIYSAWSLEHSLEQIKLGVQDLEAIFRTTAQYAYAAQRVFAVPELLEQILEELDFRTLLAVDQVSRRFHEVVENSDTLQQRLCLKPDFESYFWSPFTTNFEDSGQTQVQTLGRGCALCKPQSPPSNSKFEWPLANFPYPGFEARCTETILIPPGEKKKNDLEQFWIKINKKLRIGSRIREMLVCQPPVQIIHYHPSCCANWEVMEAKTTDGLTIGDINDLALDVMEKHWTCPVANHENHHVNGDVHVSVNFGARVRITASDPLRMRWIKERRELEACQLKLEERRRLDKFIEAKRKAFHKGWPIPVFAEIE